MKKLVWCLVAVIAALLSCSACYAENGFVDGIPQKVVDLLAGKGIEKQCIEDYILIDVVEAPVPLRHLFVLASLDGTHHTVYHFTNSESDEYSHLRWAYKTSYDSLAPQGKGTVCFYRHSADDRYGYNDSVQLYDDMAGFTIARTDLDRAEYDVQQVSVHVMDKQFQIIAWLDRSAAPDCSAYVKNGKLYYVNHPSGKNDGAVRLYRTFDLNVSFSSLPKTYQRAVEQFTEPARIPSGELQAKLIQFTANKQYAVYSAPDETSFRSGNGKATVSTNDWIQVFGQEDDWILIQYAIDSGHYRFGYIPAAALPRKTSVGQLNFQYTSAYTARAVSVTDDPLYSQAALITLPEGCPVTWLATMGNWAYIESSTGDWLRGFVPVSAIRTDRVLDMAAQPDSHGPVYTGTLTIHADQTVTVSCAIHPAGSLGNAAVSSVRLCAPDGSILCTTYVDASGKMTLAHGRLKSGETVIQFVAVDPFGNVLNDAVSVEW